VGVTNNPIPLQPRLAGASVGAAFLEPVRESFRTGQAIKWTRVHDLPDFAYFDHSIHVAKGVGCATCHGPVDKMPLMRKQSSLQMEWCLDCHRHPERYVRPREEVFNMNYVAPANQLNRPRSKSAVWTVVQRPYQCTNVSACCAQNVSGSSRDC
jgi:hypothetical protein